MSQWTHRDREWMAQALALAVQSRGFVEPNPMVGCVIVRNDRVVGVGRHQRYGGPHAEAHALREAGRRASGATAYVTLEPCAHHGKTPPCADALIDAGIGRCVVAMRDPNPLVAGRGLRRLRNAGIEVDIGLMRAEALALNAPFVTFHTQSRPYVTLKWAQSLDGKIATVGGDSKWITSRESRRKAHALRARVDAIVVGIETVLADDPELTARFVRPKRIATRVVLDRMLRTPPTAKLVQTAKQVPTIIFTSNAAAKDAKKRSALERCGCEIVAVPGGKHGLNLQSVLTDLHGRQMTNVMVEGGGRLLGSFWDAGLADAAEVFVAPRLIGGRAAPGPLGGVGASSMGELIGVRVVERADCGPDIWYNLQVRR